MKTPNKGDLNGGKAVEFASIAPTEPMRSKSIQLCSKHILSQLDYIAEIESCSIDQGLKYALIERVVDEMKHSCDSILKCIDA